MRTLVRSIHVTLITSRQVSVDLYGSNQVHCYRWLPLLQLFRTLRKSVRVNQVSFGRPINTRVGIVCSKSFGLRANET